MKGAMSKMKCVQWYGLSNYGLKLRVYLPYTVSAHLTIKITAQLLNEW